MNAVDKDDFSHALGQTLAFYGKELDSTQFSFWYRALSDRPIEKIKAALLEYVKIGRFAPRPAHILELIGSSTEQARNTLPPPDDSYTKCPEEIHDAWTWFIGMYCKDSRNMDGVFKRDPVSAELEERYLHIVNHEAQKAGMPDAIPDEFKLKEVFG